MSAKRPQTFAKRARELAVKERRDLKRARKAEAAAQRAAGIGERRRRRARARRRARIRPPTRRRGDEDHGILIRPPFPNILACVTKRA